MRLFVNWAISLKTNRGNERTIFGDLPTSLAFARSRAALEWPRDPVEPSNGPLNEISNFSNFSTCYSMRFEAVLEVSRLEL